MQSKLQFHQCTRFSPAHSALFELPCSNLRRHTLVRCACYVRRPKSMQLSPDTFTHVAFMAIAMHDHRAQVQATSNAEAISLATCDWLHCALRTRVLRETEKRNKRKSTSYMGCQILYTSSFTALRHLAHPPRLLRAMSSAFAAAHTIEEMPAS